VLISFFFFNEDFFKFPAISIIMPLFLVSLILALSGTQNLVLNSRVMTYVGDRSYSIYLWHWPFVMIGRYIFPENFLARTSLLFVAIISALFVFKYIENPIRFKLPRSSKNLTKVLAIFLLIPIGSAAALGYYSSVVLFPKYESNVIKGNYRGDVGALGFEEFSNQQPKSCPDQYEPITEWLKVCNMDVLIIGDSHARHLLPGLSSYESNLSFSSMGQDIVTSNAQNSHSRVMQSLTTKKSLRLVIFNSYWARNGVPEQLKNVSADLIAAGKKIIILDDVPNFPFDAFSCKYGTGIFIRSSVCSTSSVHFESQRADYLPKLKLLTSGQKDSELILTSRLFCSQHQCSMLKNGVLNYLDLNHLNTFGSKYVSKYLIQNSNIFCAVFRDKNMRLCESTTS
jgi:hypothetical protein